ncbi:protein kinase [Mitsuaria sp. GD03876]|uniref:serine/threonine protein kinase n=1 Tax=Mitsuaria sp. GD03876 TaxID=2975399 RepID=UPI00244AF222|nr:protein kinase [Mitsuaria sp. GD03876]MDH0867536.1 protein kinase [Mitsuaria sp. GD03876]
MKVVVRKDGSAPEQRFLKILKHQNDAGRRRRMYREVAAYQTLQHPDIPKLIETNAHKFDDLAFKLYLVTEHVAGTPFGDHVEAHGPLSLQDALQFTIALLDIVDRCHQSDIVHRDIKPDNIILRASALSAPRTPVLVDFGLSFNRSDVAPNATGLDEEVGNRFLRLPELAPNSADKRDPRSDVTFCAGVLLYALTGRVPAVLTDGQERLPHQVDSTKEALRRLDDDWRERQLKRVFDTAFQHALDRRWQSAGALRDELVRIQSGDTKTPLTREELQESVQTLVQSQSLMTKAKLTSSFEGAINEIGSVVHTMATSGQLGALRSMQTDQRINVGERWAVTHHCFAFVPPSSLQPYIQFRIEAVGNELVVAATYAGERTELHRTPLEAPQFDIAFAHAVEATFLKQIHAELDAS